MLSLIRVVNFMVSIIFLIGGVLSFFLGGMLIGIFPEFAAFSMLFAILPIVLIFLSILGLYGVLNNNIKVQMAFDILLLPFWNVGTVVGAVCLILFLVERYKVTGKSISSDAPDKP
jgi:hypothetical protein